MEFTINTDTWFLICVFFISAMALYMVLFIAIPFFKRREQLGRIKDKTSRSQQLVEEIEKRQQQQTLTQQELNIERLETDLLKHIKALLNSNPDSINLTTFYADFEKVYPNFKTSLKAKSDNLSANDVKLSAFLRLNLSTKDIAKLQNITPDSVNKARYRLRKKLELNKNDNLFHILSEL